MCANPLPVLLRAVLLTVIACNASFAQHQRLGLPAQEISLRGSAKSATVEAFCLDLQLYASNAFVPYKQVLTEDSSAFVITTAGKKIPLQSAIRQGLVSVAGAGDSKTASGLALKFNSHSATVDRIVFEKGTAFGESSGASVASSSPILSELNRRVTGETSREKNDRIWRAQAPERMLQELGFYGTRVVNPSNTESAVRDFQDSFGMAASGEMDAPTLSKLSQENNLLISQLKDVGFEFQSSQTKVLALSEPLRDFQTYHGLKSDGTMSAQTRTLLTKEAATAEQVRSLYSDRRPVASIVTSTDFPDVVTSFVFEDTLYALTKSGDDYDFSTFNGTRYHRLGTGRRGLVGFATDFDLATASLNT
jgi:hypothetical protein